MLIYVAAEIVAGRPDAHAVIIDHPEWWLHDDNGVAIKGPWVNFTVPSFQDWFGDYVPGWYGAEVASLFDGLFVDAAGYQPAMYHRNHLFVKDPSKYNNLFLAKMAMLKKTQEKYAALNGGMVIGNQALGFWTATYDTWPDMDWRSNVGLFGGGSFVEWFGALEMDNDGDGSWNIGQMERAFKGVIESSKAGYPVVLKAAPGPVHMRFERRCSTVPPSSCRTTNSTNYFHVLEWASAEKVAESADGARADAQRQLTQTLAPFLIISSKKIKIKRSSWNPMCSSATRGSTASRTATSRALKTSSAGCPALGSPSSRSRWARPIEQPSKMAPSGHARFDTPACM